MRYNSHTHEHTPYKMNMNVDLVCVCVSARVDKMDKTINQIVNASTVITYCEATFKTILDK